MDTGPNMIADFLCLVFILMPGKCSVLYLIIRESESVENPKWGAAIIIYFPAISYAAFLGWIHDFFYGFHEWLLFLQHHKSTT